MLLEQIEQRYRQAVDSRVDDDGTVFYFSAADFAGLRRQAFAFPSSDGHTLQGYFYWYDRCKKDRLIVFDHGMGSGHRGYMIEIELLARRGFLVFAYDHTGCMESGGDGMGGFTQSLRDLNDALNALKTHETYGSLPIAVMGHSWGGYAALNIAAYHPDVTHIVAMAGFLSLENAIGQFFRGPLAYFGKRIYAKADDWKTPFAIEITDTVDWSRKKQNVVVRVQDKFGAGGIWKPVYVTVKDDKKSAK